MKVDGNNIQLVFIYEILKKFTIKTEMKKITAKRHSSKFSVGGNFSENEPHPEKSHSRVFFLKPFAVLLS